MIKIILKNICKFINNKKINYVYGKKLKKYSKRFKIPVIICSYNNCKNYFFVNYFFNHLILNLLLSKSLIE